MKLDISSDPVADMIDRYLEQSYTSEKRTYLGASSIGDECSRKLQYRLRGHEEKFNAATIRRFNDGHRSEDIVLDWLRSIGIELHTRNAEGEQLGFFVDGFGGHYDGIGRGFPQAPKTWHIVEVKVVSEENYKKLEKLKSESEKTAIMQWNMTYYAQVQVYMHAEKLERSIHCVTTAGARGRLLTVRTEYDRKFAESMFTKAKRILGAKDLMERIGKEDYYKCRMCGFRDICHK